ncbi:MAG: YdbL family protein [Pseudomonadota bacterium]|nr:MAG: YdbL family protein [Pseudomonadota bacterium]
MTSFCFLKNARGVAAIVLAAFLAGGWATPALALSLDQAKSQGLVGEQADGYLGVVSPGASSEVKALVTDINAKRRNEYQAIAKRNNTTLDKVEALAGKKAIDLTPAGQHVRLPSGQWVKKK